MMFSSTVTPVTETYTFSLHDALPISPGDGRHHSAPCGAGAADAGADARAGLHRRRRGGAPRARRRLRSEEHTSELQSPCKLVCRHLLEKKIYLAIEEATITTEAELAI